MSSAPVDHIIIALFWLLHGLICKTMQKCPTLPQIC